MATVSAHVGEEDGWPPEASPWALTTKEIKVLHGKTLISFSLDLLSAFGTPPNGCGNNHNDVDVHVARYYLPTCGHHLLGIAHPIIVLGFSKIKLPPIPSPNISINTSESTNVSSMYPSPGNNHVPSTHKIPWVQFPKCHHSNGCKFLT